jgi:hypothetical protein
MKPRALLNLALILLLGILVAIAVLEPGRDEETPEGQPLTTLQREDIDHLIITRSGLEPLALQRDGKRWFIDGEPRLPANPTRVEALLSLAGARPTASYPRNQAELTKFGLGAQKAIGVQLNDTQLLVGGSDPIKHRRYILTGDTMHLVQDTFSFHLMSGATDWINTELLPAGGEIIGLQLPGITLTQSDRGGWAGEGIAEGVSSDRIQAFVDGWRYAQAQAVLPMTDANANNDSGEAVVVILRDQLQPIEMQLQQVGSETYLTRSDWKIRYHLSTWQVESLLQAPQPEPSENEGKADAADKQ